MVFSEVTEEERARWIRMLVMFVLIGFIIAFTPELTSWLTGITIDPNTDDPNIPDGIENVSERFFVFARYLGALVMAAGGGVAAIKLELR
ncbi:MAG: hypothetical protein KatS3mg003_1879 [Candidatus Nitrosocaldaceae archaeon]|nr:MAG: hypothetical protein KatS3mg003_1453 [Candidatus Nitrosocaldaceae archaeon]GIU72400.1 MAG: hypothetical protein KatS3mg003_1879 [Candidatus Nitrosocaldaceae archaeon]